MDAFGISTDRDGFERGFTGLANAGVDLRFLASFSSKYFLLSPRLSSVSSNLSPPRLFLSGTIVLVPFRLASVLRLARSSPNFGNQGLNRPFVVSPSISSSSSRQRPPVKFRVFTLCHSLLQYIESPNSSPLSKAVPRK